MSDTSPEVPILRRLDDLRALTRAWRRAGERIAVVPTMGALHAGHISLVAAARTRAERVIVTIFVNPRQFNSREDYEKYPRTEEADAVLLEPFAVDAVFVPAEHEVYPEGFATTVSVSGLTAPLEGEYRPGHFDGMSTVVTKLLTMTSADCAMFGEKDWQQLQVVRRMARDLNLDCEIVPCPTVREPDGLALSSRNQRLTHDARAMSAALPRALLGAAAEIAEGRAPGPVLETARAAVLGAGFDSIDYLELRDAETLGPAIEGRPARLFVAAWAGPVRLIDNVPIAVPAG
ncbi:pantoate--beta-alanine ligase [Frigidibacter sp. MR17.24]|uniref:pantoate--beta-alanine ligase n=1 Tax=Frigidibacter sp. MR17.24 TaxID=3127345 RepID=UPI003012B9A1